MTDQIKNPRPEITNTSRRDWSVSLYKDASIAGKLAKQVRASKTVKRIMDSRIGKYVAELNDTSRYLYPKSRKAVMAAPLIPVPGATTVATTTHALPVIATHAATKFPKVQAIVDYLSKTAGTMQTEYQVKGNKVYRIYHSSSNFEGAKQPNIEAKYFTRKDEINDFSEKREILRRLKLDEMSQHKKLAEKKKTGPLTDKEIKSKLYAGAILGGTTGLYLSGAASMLGSNPGVMMIKGTAAGLGLGTLISVGSMLANTGKRPITDEQKKKYVYPVATAGTIAAGIGGYKYIRGAIQTPGSIANDLKNPLFTSEYAGHGKFASSLTEVVKRTGGVFKKMKFGADPEILALRTPKKRFLLPQILKPKNVDAFPNKTSRDPTVAGVELHPNATSDPSKMVEDLRGIVKSINDAVPNSEVKMTGLAALPRSGSTFFPNVAGGHIHVDVPKGHTVENTLERGSAGALLPHYIVGGAKQRAVGGSYGNTLLDHRTRRMANYNWGGPASHTNIVEVRHSPTWMDNPDLAKKTLESVKLTTSNPETFEMTRKFMKGLLADTNGQTRNLYNPKTHSKVMNYYEKLYAKAGVTSDPALSKIFDQAAKAQPSASLDITKNWLKQ